MFAPNQFFFPVLIEKQDSQTWYRFLSKFELKELIWIRLIWNNYRRFLINVLAFWGLSAKQCDETAVVTGTQWEQKEEKKQNIPHCRYFPYFTRLTEAQQLGNVCHAFQSRTDGITLCFLHTGVRDSGNDFDLPSTLCLTMFLLTKYWGKKKTSKRWNR